MKKKIKFLAIVVILIGILFSNINVLNIKANEGNFVYLGGQTAGFTLKTKGATIVGLSEVVCQDKITSPSKNANLKVGDIIISLNDKEINGIVDLEDFLTNYKSGNVVCKILRNGEYKLLDIIPEKDINGNFKIGVFLREDLNGLGTITYINKDGYFASLGHPVSNEKGDKIDVFSGKVYDCSIIGVVKAKKGRPGELKGLFLGDNEIGYITKNCSTGMYGYLNNFNNLDYIKIKVGEPTIGKAQIVSTVDGKTCKNYDIEIVKTNYFTNSNKNIVVKITDKELLNYTGGILQGMSGSPIVQNGKLVGAITHVFVNDSSRGYGISIQNMFLNNEK